MNVAVFGEKERDYSTYRVKAGAEKEVHQVLLLLPVPSITLEAADASQLKTSTKNPYNL